MNDPVSLRTDETKRTDRRRWCFFRAGGLEQVRLRNGSDLANLARLDPKLWVILSCPLKGVRFDARTLELLDSDSDGRIRVPELLEGIRWICRRLRDPDILMAGAEEVRLEDLAADNPEGAVLLDTAKRMLDDIGKSEARAFGLGELAARRANFARTPFNGDGVITPDSARDGETAALISEIVACMGGKPDRCGTQGIDQHDLDAFYAAVREHVAWRARADEDPALRPLEDATPDAVRALDAVASKVEDYFMRCRLAAFDARAAGPLNRGEEDYAALAALELGGDHAAIAELPLARVEAHGLLPLRDAVNPAWADRLNALADKVVTPLLGADVDCISESQWGEVKSGLAPYKNWIAEQSGAVVAPLGIARLRAILAGPGHEKIAALIERDAAFAAENERLLDIEKLVRYHCHLVRLAHNYANFADFYDPDREAIFRCGALYIDGRRCALCLHVDDMARHALLATAGKIFLAYCEITRPVTQEKRRICAAITAGFAESLWVGRNGIFFDRDGHDWDAVIVKVCENPISLKEAFWSPWRKIAAMIGEQVRKLLTARQDAIFSATATQLDQAGTAAAAGKPSPASTRMEGAALASSVAAIGIAVGLVGSAVGGLIGIVSGLPLWKSLLGVLLIMLAVSGPSVILAYFKLHARDLAPVLNASGWAVNGRILMTMRLGRVLTSEAHIPFGSEREFRDPYAESRRVWYWAPILVVTGLILWWYRFRGWL